MKAVDITYVMKRLGVSEVTVSRWITGGVLTPLDSFEDTFDLDEVEGLLPPRIRKKNVTLINVKLGMRLVGCKSCHTLRRWAEDEVISLAILPAAESCNPRFLRYVLEELQLIKCIPHLMTTCRLSTLVFESGLSRERLWQWIEQGVLPARPNPRYPDGPIIRTTDVMRLLVNELYM